MTLLDLMGDRYPQVPGWKARETAKAAAEAEKPRAPTIRQMILASMKTGHMWTPDGFAAEHRLDRLAVRPRFSELAKLGRIEDSGFRQANDSGRDAILWRLKDDA